ncbi:MAG: hypothetical protein IPL95_16625 [Saprospiraceae bacterium]|nr:hypothetical protein [Saprospiraceae bacterium]
MNDTTKKIEIDHLIIDPHLYAKASITNILKLDGGGSLSGFGFSIDKFGLSILNNDLEDVFFEGIISLPINKEGED